MPLGLRMKKQQRNNTSINFSHIGFGVKDNTNIPASYGNAGIFALIVEKKRKTDDFYDIQNIKRIFAYPVRNKTYLY